jgi:decaprenylphospho-beta-D-ribofuranose 2-oxidase
MRASTMADGTPLPATTHETATFHSFDGGYHEKAAFHRPDRYRAVEAAARAGRVIARGGGYSYAAASFGAGSVVLDMTRLDRVLRFEPAQMLIEVEAGMRLEQLLELTAPRGLILPVQPGYPAITIGGCVAANVHGKNPQHEGAIRHAVVDVTLLHPRLGILRCDARNESGLFELTCGGYGLTGVILAVTLRLEALPGWTAAVERAPIESLAEGLARVRERTDGAAFAYTWHQGTPVAGVFGRGFVYVGHTPQGRLPRDGVVPRYRRLTSSSRRRLVAPFWGAATIRLLGTTFRASEGLRPVRSEMPLFDAMFPFAKRGEYFLLYGSRGLAEYQALVPHAAVSDFLGALEREALRSQPPIVMASLKLFRGEPKLLRFEGDGVCVTLDLVRSAEGLRFLELLDRLTLEHGALPNIIKDSRLPAAVVARSYPGYEEFRERRRALDPAAGSCSELSARLAL